MSTYRIFYPNKTKNIFFLLISILFAVIGIFMIQDREPSGWLPALFFGGGALVLIVNLIPGSAYLKLTDQGFEIKTLFKTKLTRWKDVTKFEVSTINHNKMIVFDYSPHQLANQNTKKLSKTLTGWEGALPETYGQPAQDLADLLNSWKQRYS